MAYTESKIPLGRKHFFTARDRGTASIAQSLSLSYPIEINEIKIALSTAHASAEYFRAFVSYLSGSGHASAYSYHIISQIMNGSVAHRFQISVILNYGETLRTQMLLSSANVWGIVIDGWAIE